MPISPLLRNRSGVNFPEESKRIKGEKAARKKLKRGGLGTNPKPERVIPPEEIPGRARIGRRLGTDPNPKGPLNPKLPALTPKQPAPQQKKAAKKVKRAGGAVLGGIANIGKLAQPAPKQVSRPAPSGGGGSVPATAPAPRGGGSVGGAVGGPKPKKVKKQPKTVKAPAAAAPPAVPEEQSIMDQYFGPAMDELARQGTEADRTRGLQVTDAEALRKWMSDQNLAAESFLERGLNASRTAIPTNSLLEQAQARATAATGGNADLNQAAGIDASNAALAAQTQADAARRGAPELQSQVFTRGLADQRGITSATMSNVLGSINSNYNNRLSEIAKERAGMALEGAKLGQAETAAKRTADQDAKMFNLIAKEKLGNLEVAKTNATTKRLQVITTAENARQALSLKAQVEGGKLSLAEAREAFNQELKSQNLSIAKRKLELARFDSQTKRMKATGADVGKLSNYAQDRYDTYLKQYGVADFNQVPPNEQRKIVRNVITGLRGSGGANLSQGQALAILGGIFGDIPSRDPAFRSMVTALWPR